MKNELDEGIKLIAATATEFATMEAFRALIPEHCKDQINSIGSGFGGYQITYKQLFNKAIKIPKNPLKIDYGDGFMRVFYDKFLIIAPCGGKPIEMVFVGANEIEIS